MKDSRLSCTRYPDLYGRSVFISGGATGIGKSLVEAFCAQGAHTAFVDIDVAAAEALVAKLRAAGGKVEFMRCDVCDIEQLRSCMDTLATALGPFSVLLNNAANDRRHTLASLEPEDFDQLVSVNLKHYVFAIQKVLPMMQQLGGGSVINFGSFGWMINNSGYPAYAASKAGVHGLTKGLCQELGADGVRINTLVPGWVMTEKQQALWVDEKATQQIADNQAMRGQLLPEHVAQMALFLASDASCMCSGQNYLVDGGWA